MTDLDRQLERMARVGTLLVASDFDGTLSPIVNEPSEARPLQAGVDALAALADLERTHVAVVSGRALSDLRSRAHTPAHVHLIGGHGVESASLPPVELSAAQAALRERIARELARIAGSATGLAVEEKPGSVAFHYRNAEPGPAAHAVSRVRELARSLSGVNTLEGKKVIELSVASGDKGRALRSLADALGVDATIYIGDDVTDEDAFAALVGSDLGIKVGGGVTAARCRVADPAGVVDTLARLLALRSGQTG